MDILGATRDEPICLTWHHGVGVQRNQIRKVVPEDCQTLKIQIWALLSTWYLVPEGCQTLKTQMVALGT